MTGPPQSRTPKLSLIAALAIVVCPLLIPTAKADSWFSNPEHAATAKTVDGDVSVLRGLEKWALDAGDKVQVKQTIVTGKDGRALFEVSDGSSFRVFPNSTVVFRKNSGNLRDLLDVMLGRVRVKIQHEPNKPNPHNIRTPSAVISVRGTEFDINVDEIETTVVEVTEGIVAVRHAMLGGSEIQLREGDKVTVLRNAPVAKARGNGVMQVVRMALDAVVAGAANPGARGGGGGIGGIGGGTIGGGGIGGVGGVGDTGTNPNPTPGGSTTIPTPPSLPTIPTPPGLPGGSLFP